MTNTLTQNSLRKKMLELKVLCTSKPPESFHLVLSSCQCTAETGSMFGFQLEVGRSTRNSAQLVSEGLALELAQLLALAVMWTVTSDPSRSNCRDMWSVQP